MPTQIQYPIVQGVRMDPSSVEFKILAPVNQVILFVSIDWKRTRSRKKVVLNHPDPVGKTRGKNDYEFNLELAIEEWALIINTMGAGYGDVQFAATLNIRETGFDPILVEFFNCSLDEDAGDISGDGNLSRKYNLNPTKIKTNGLDDLAVPLIGVATQ